MVCEDNNFSNIVNCSYTWDISEISDANYYITMAVTDSTDTTFKASDNKLGIDNTAPITYSNNLENWYVLDTNIIITCEDYVSDCYEIYYRLDQDVTDDLNYSDWNLYTSQISLVNDGNYGVEFYGVDDMNYSSDVNLTYFLIDKSVPSLDIVQDENITTVNTSYDVNYLGEDTVSDIKQYFISNDGVTFTSTVDLNYTLVGGVGDTNYLYVIAQNNADLNSITRNVTVYFTSGTDTDLDGIPDSNDSILGDSNLINKNGFDNNLVVVIGGVTNRDTSSGLKTVEIDDLNNPVISFDHNFDLSELDINKINLTKGTDYIIVDLNGAIQDDQNKTVYIEDNDYDFICVKNALVNSINEMSNNCDSTDEYKFPTCLTEGTQTTTNVICTKTGSKVKFENLRFTALKGFVTIISSGGSSCTPLWYCTQWSDCNNNIQTRSCEITNNCVASYFGKPSETMTCESLINNNQNIDENIFVNDSLVDNNYTINKIIDQNNFTDVNSVNTITSDENINLIVNNDLNEINKDTKSLFWYWFAIIIVIFIFGYFLIKLLKNKYK